MRTVKIKCHDAHGEWTETYKEGERGSFTERDIDLDMWSRKLIGRFNATLRPNETERFVDGVSVSIDTNQIVYDHDWHKTNAITISDRIGVYDTIRCERCGVTGKRFGLENVKRDSQFRAKKYEKCNGALST